jgi:hypothetical protein
LLSAPAAVVQSTHTIVPQDKTTRTRSPETRHRRLMLTAAGGVGLALIVVAHLTLAGAATVIPLWLGWSAAGVLLVPAIVVAFHAVGPLTVFGVVRHVLGRGPTH